MSGSHLPRPLAGALLAAAAIAIAACDDGAAVGDAQFQTSLPSRSWEPAPVRAGNLRVAELNVRNFPGEAAADAAGPSDAVTSGRVAAETDREMLLDLLGKLEFDLLAVEEIRDTAAFDAVLAELGARKGATYAAVYAENSVSHNEQHVGLVARTDRVTLSDVAERPEIDVKGTLRSGLAARAKSATPGGADFGVMVLHLASGDSAKRALLRQEQATQAAAAVSEAQAESGDDDFIVLGDLNTAREEAEYGALDAAFGKDSGLVRRENELGCTSYFVKNKLGTLAPSTIDQVYLAALDEIDPEVPLTSGAHCFERACEPFESDGPATGTSYWGVSDHCPIYFELRDADDDPPAP